MAIDFSEMNYLADPDVSVLKADHVQFLLSISGPTVIDISGRDQTRTRVICTLIHGNEPSGLIAMHRWLSSLQSNDRPLTNIRFIICSPEAASCQPIFSYRFLDDGKDLNRCFSNNKNQGYYLRANVIKQAINEVSPEAVFDIHNTSGMGPAFAVATKKTELALSYTSIFCKSLILSDINLGALMEQDFGCQTITIECGGSNDAYSHEVAFKGLGNLAQIDDIKRCHFQRDVDVFLQPLRLQIKTDVDIAFTEQTQQEQGIRFINDIEQLNFSTVRKGKLIAWLDDNGLDDLYINDIENNNVIDQYFEQRHNQMVSKMDLNIFMATRVERIAKTDCVFYLVAHKNQM